MNEALWLSNLDNMIANKFHTTEILEVGKNIPKLFAELLNQSTNVLLVSPFIKLPIARDIVSNFKGSKGRLLTRFNLNDFRTGVSDIEALELLHSEGFQIAGLRGLHAKTYIFDDEFVITTSANLTSGGFHSNEEYGILAKSHRSVQEAKKHFNNLWIHASGYDPIEAISWKNKISTARKSKDESSEKLEDYGGTFKKHIVEHQTFVKWLGTGSERAGLDYHIFEYIRETGSNFAVCFHKKPRRYNNGDQVFIAVMTKDNDYAIFGRALAYKYVDGRDVASDHEIGLVGWKKNWKHYIRIHSVEFINGTFQDCPKLYRDITDKLDFDSFKTTQERHFGGETDINVKSAVKQQGDVRLSDEGKILLNNLFEDTIKVNGAVPQSLIDNLYNGNIQLGL